MAERYDRSMLEAHPAFQVPPPSPELAAKVTAASWPDGLLDRLLALRFNRSEIERWLDDGYPTAEMIEEWVVDQEGQLTATLSVRQAGWDDNDLIVDLCANAPERVGAWDVTVERGPNAFAQFRLQEHAFVVVVEDLRVGLGMVTRSIRNSYIAGERTSIHFISGWRVRDGFRGRGLSKLLMEGAGPGHGPFGVSFYWYVRHDNDDRAWVAKVTGDMADRPDGWGAATDVLTATVTHFDEPAQGRPSPRARPATEADLPACCELINRTNDGLDLFRPYTPDFLAARLDDPNWGPRPSFIAAVYGWDDFRVIDRDGEIVACGGLWDRARDLRERWCHRETGEEHVVETTALMDAGLAPGAEADFAELVGHHLATTASLGRSAMTAALEFVDLGSALEHLSSRLETRELQTMPFVSPELAVKVDVQRPHTDLAYW